MQNMQKNATLQTNLSSRIPDGKSAEFWRLGDRVVRRIGFGTKRLAGSADGQDVQERAVALLHRAIELGVNHLDTADFYPTYAESGQTRSFEGLNWANDVIRRALAPYREDLVIATKVGPTASGLARPDELPALVERDLRTLGVDTLDVVYLRQAGLDDVSEHFGVLAELRAKGMIKHLGLSNVRLEHITQAQDIAPVVSVQNRYGVGFGRVNDDLLRVCGEQGIAFVPFFALTAAAREAGGVSSNDAVQEVADQHNATPAQIRLAWTLSRGDHVLAIPGTSSTRHLEENLAAGAIRLSPGQLAVLDSIEEVQS
ncbi:MAG TPA: aldo/keto reductase [Kribbella sp.]|nr:aldo/keto reductase [Kribbella sp.]